MAGLACVAFAGFYMMWKYLFLWQLDQPASGDTGGLFFPKAIQHTMVGLYLQQALLAILLFLAKAIPQGAVVVVLIVFTAFFHIVFNNSFRPLINPLPLTLSDRTYGATEEDDVANAADEGFGGSDSGGEDQTVRRRVSPDSDARGEKYVENTQPIVGQGDGENAYGASVPTEGKRNDGPTDFNHPASIEPQRIIWIPKDPLGLGDAEALALNSSGVEASTENAEMNAKGTTDISGHPPGMTSAIDP
jgi:calcium permeable stress-gated cation channel